MVRTASPLLPVNLQKVPGAFRLPRLTAQQCRGAAGQHVHRAAGVLGGVAYGAMGEQRLPLRDDLCDEILRRLGFTAVQELARGGEEFVILFAESQLACVTDDP